mmetsp:Transcript_39836/g.86261  ORF Transcript_39836/g.86261 Transcript_39836/m.86261 type:complete len:235 (-) Transcript_39836:301-1005(-)
MPPSPPPSRGTTSYLSRTTLVATTSTPTGDQGLCRNTHTSHNSLNARNSKDCSRLSQLGCGSGTPLWCSGRVRVLGPCSVGRSTIATWLSLEGTLGSEPPQTGVVRCVCNWIGRHLTSTLSISDKVLKGMSRSQHTSTVSPMALCFGRKRSLSALYREMQSCGKCYTWTGHRSLPTPCHSSVSQSPPNRHSPKTSTGSPTLQGRRTSLNSGRCESTACPSMSPVPPATPAVASL